uniref:Uncharacterized protein n=1 Tax=Lotharella globosa TaxID=91324 RepID=A0A7S3ZB17_9EUKA|mmetsp:Transcript_8563/g.16577  ORF Transcript_8563/g.16577 Transcript_8563/m.16577 type:complete len:858 (+) Transcript_8563:47-2620(+)|eukprot:CAMPEP_0167811654 /NCGR_PEP_ID=MMETSP0112_2-20121227/797_1 /TAXON_ID=91324 /ORGANISM="Lotharella globosa, Strain CCCM811" /LENGTH=857 /DNA_ID=CAMNT_0007710407 /DNA_START=39 /DNA_END=2612 /DNA_ORIENTATION=+
MARKKADDPPIGIENLWISFFCTINATIALFASSVWAVYMDDDCDTHLCLCAGWGMVVAGFMAVNAAVGLYTTLMAGKEYKQWSIEGDEHEENQRFLQSPESPIAGARGFESGTWAQKVVTMENSVTMMLTLILMYASMMSIIFWTRVNDENSTLRYLAFVISLLASAASEFYTLAAKVAFVRVSRKGRNKMVLLASNVLLFAMGVTLTALNSSLLENHDRWMFHGMLAVGVMCCISALFGLGITAVSHSKLSNAFLSSTALPIPYLLIEMFTLGTSILFTVGNIYLAVVIELKPGQDDMLTGLELNSAVGFVVCIVTFLIHSAYDQMLNPVLISRYSATEIDINEVEEKTLKRWASMITNAHGTKFIGAWDGEAAISLIRTYMKTLTGGQYSGVPYVRGVLLRIDRDQGDPEFGDGTDPAALVFVTIVEKFDLTRYLPGGFGSFLSFLFGAHGCLPILALRWGLIGFQFPFRSGIFLMSKDADAINEMTHVQRAIVTWNDTSPLHCDVLMSPCYITQADSMAFEQASFLNLQIGPSVVVDLRRFKGLTYKEFQRVALKKGNRRNHHDFFAKKGGTVHASRDFKEFDPGYARVAASLCASTAGQRAKKGEVPILCPVTPRLIQNITEEHKEKFRRVFGVKVRGTPAGSAVLFEFPKSKLMTSDMQGLLHEIARPTRAYFAMLALTVEKALEEGYDLLDFGPTTLEPKLDVGGRLIECRAGYHTRSMLMRSLLKRGTDNFRSQQEEVEARMRAGEKEEASPWRSYRLPYVESDFQTLTEDIKTRYRVEKKIVPYSEEKAPDNNVSGKKSKKQLNKEKRKAARKARLAAQRAAAAARDGDDQKSRSRPSANPTIAPTND